MPELPEVETVVRSLAPHLPGRTIILAELLAPRILRGSSLTTPDRFDQVLIQSIERHGKNIVLDLSNGVLIIHLGMTGKLLLDASRTPYTRAVFHLDDGRFLVYDDVRQFGRIEWSPALPGRLEELGPDPTNVAFEVFLSRLADRKTKIKPLLLNQSFLRGIGNIYADEALYRAGIHPRTIAGRIKSQRAARLHGAIQDVLQQAIAHRGSSISDYVDAEGEKGSFQQMHQVYGREGKPCPQCGRSIRRIVLGQRSTHYCPRCQR